MTVTLTDVTLWVGPGGSLDDSGTPLDVTDATSFSDDDGAGGRPRLQWSRGLAQARVAEEHQRHADDPPMT